MYRRRTFWPSGPVWWVLSCMPRICPASAFTSSSVRASLTPPPLPRPPAWICAFTTQTAPPSFCAASSASRTVKAGVAARHRHAVRAQQFLGLVFVDLHGRSLGGRVGRVGLSPVRWLVGTSVGNGCARPGRRCAAHGSGRSGRAFGVGAGAAGVDHLTGHGLHDGGGQHLGEFGDVGAAQHAADLFAQRLRGNRASGSGRPGADRCRHAGRSGRGRARPAMSRRRRRW